MILRCPICGENISTRDLRRRDGVKDGRECPNCGQLVQFSQPYPIFRWGAALLASGLVLWLTGVRSTVWFLIGSVLLWLPMSLVVNGAAVHVMSLELKPWKARAVKRWEPRPRDNGPLDLFGSQRR